MPSDRARKAAEALLEARFWTVLGHSAVVGKLADLIDTAAGIAELEEKAARVEELERELSEVVDDTVLIDGFPAMRGTPDLPLYLAEQRRIRAEWEEQAEARVIQLRQRLDAVIEFVADAAYEPDGWSEEVLRRARGEGVDG